MREVYVGSKAVILVKGAKYEPRCARRTEPLEISQPLTLEEEHAFG